ncbi:MAG: RepB family plasmid replication initiator protein [Haemophilus parainfluenzae]|nr:RepB family plasmid replication initiator protein [Haemophilus parainfluenzae]
MSNEIVVVDNSLVTSAYHLTLNEQRLILCALKKIEPMVEMGENQVFYISRDDFIELGVNPDIVSQEIRQATRDLMKKSVTVKTPLGTLEMPWLSEVLRFDKNAEQKLRELYPNPDDYDDYIRALRLHNLIDSFTHRADENIVARVVFHQKILPLLSNLKKNFTQFSIQDVAEFKSTYAHRIYQLMMQYKSTGYVKITIDDLKFMLMLGLKYALFADFKKRVLDVAIDEINGKSPYNVQYELIKKGRKFVAIELKFAPKVKEKPLSEPTRDQKTIDIFDNLTDQEHDIIAQKNAYADSIGATAEHRQNLIKQALKQHQDAIQAEQEAKQRKKAERQAQKEHEKQQLELARQQYEQILASDTLINAYIANNINPQKMRASLQKMRYEQGDFRSVVEMEQRKFEHLHEWQRLNLKFLDGVEE